jgi:hypothetical protein
VKFSAAILLCPMVACALLLDDRSRYFSDLTDAAMSSSQDGGGGVDVVLRLDSGRDANDAKADAPALPFCEAFGDAGTICDDFDRGALGAKWSAGVFTQFGGTIALDPSVSRNTSAPNGLHLQLPNTGTNCTAQLKHVTAAKPATVQVNFALRIDTAASGVNLVGFVFDLGGGMYYRVDVAFAAANGKLVVLQNTNGTQVNTELGVLARNAWHRVEIAIGFTGTKELIVRMDGVAQPTLTITAPDPATAETKLEFGAYAGTCDAATEIWYDDVTYKLTTR